MTITVHGHLSSEPATALADPQVAAIIGAAAEVHRVLGPGYLKPVYLRALELELETRAILHGRQVEFPLFYKGHKLATHNRVDFVCHGRILLHCVAEPAIPPEAEGLVLNCLRSRAWPTGVICNFGREQLDVRRVSYLPAYRWPGDD